MMLAIKKQLETDLERKNIIARTPLEVSVLNLSPITNAPPGISLATRDLESYIGYFGGLNKDYLILSRHLKKDKLPFDLIRITYDTIVSYSILKTNQVTIDVPYSGSLSVKPEEL